MGYLDSTGLARLWEKVKAAAIPAGGIIIWSGAADAVPEGWALCDGQNGTPDLRGQFVLGAGGTYSAGDAGGEETHQLTLDEMPKHMHAQASVVMGTANSDGTWGFGYAMLESASRNGYPETQYAGGSASHNNMPPYYALCYIMKKG